MQLLVIEAEQRMVLQLMQAGHDATMASSCTEAISMAEATRYDAIVLNPCGDQQVDQVTDWRTLRRSCARTPIILIVARDTAQTRVEGLDAGADDCISASCAVAELLARLRALIRRTPAPTELPASPAFD